MALSLQNSQNLLKDRINALNVLAGGIAHEVRNPLNGMNLNLDLIKRNLDNPEKIGDYVERLKGDIRKISLIVTKLLDYTRPMDLTLTQVKLKGMIENISAKVKAENQESQIEFKVLEVNGPISALVDSLRMEQVFYNLLKNAVQAIDGKGTVRVALSLTDSSVMMQFKDTGKGIPKQDREHIFDPFFTTRAEGSGLGMSIVKKIIETHKGIINVGEGEPGDLFKTNICIHLPRGADTEES
jgi:signal transduction histidine kinase